MSIETKANAPTILLVDDDENTRIIYTELLEHAGYRVISARGGEEALPMLSNEQPQVILLDIHLPGISGLEVLKRLDGTPAKGIPVVAITGRATGPELDVIRAHAFRRVLIKPTSPRVVLEVVRSLLEGGDGR